MIRYQNISRFSGVEVKKPNYRPRRQYKKKTSHSSKAQSFNYLSPQLWVEPYSEPQFVLSQSIGSSGLTWSGATSEQLAFIKKVYDINLARMSGRTFTNDVPANDLATVEGRFKLRSNAAQSAIQLLQAVRAAITASGKNVEAGLSSAYRSASHQFRLWNDYVTNQYYPITKSHRQGLDGGEHGDAAAQYLARYTRLRVAIPGYSNHNDGLAFDIKNTEEGKLYRNKTKEQFTEAWRTTWLWDWLTKNAATYHFYQNTQIDEPWHWVYREPMSSGKFIDWSKISNWIDNLKFQWIQQQLASKTFIIDESQHNLCQIPFPLWINKDVFKNDFISKHNAHARTILGDTTRPVTASYFVIHDTAATNEANNRTKPVGTTGIHMWLNNDGAHRTHDWDHRGDGTKVERGNNGCFVHTELVRHPQMDGAVAGVKQAGTYYTDLQYELLAYAYAVCSMRKGSLLEVTIHRELDRSIQNGHNDPQHFNMNRFYSLVDGILGMPISQLHPPLRDFTYGIEHDRIMQHRQDNWSGYRNEFIPYVEATVTRAEQYRPIARRRNSAGNIINTNYQVSNISTRRRC